MMHPILYIKTKIPFQTTLKNDVDHAEAWSQYRYLRDENEDTIDKVEAAFFSIQKEESKNAMPRLIK